MEGGADRVAAVTFGSCQRKCLNSIDWQAAAERQAAWSLGGSPGWVKDITSNPGLDTSELNHLEQRARPSQQSLPRETNCTMLSS